MLYLHLSIINYQFPYYEIEISKANSGSTAEEPTAAVDYEKGNAADAATSAAGGGEEAEATG